MLARPEHLEGHQLGTQHPVPPAHSRGLRVLALTLTRASCWVLGPVGGQRSQLAMPAGPPGTTCRDCGTHRREEGTPRARHSSKISSLKNPSRPGLPSETCQPADKGTRALPAWDHPPPPQALNKQCVPDQLPLSRAVWSWLLHGWAPGVR